MVGSIEQKKVELRKKYLELRDKMSQEMVFEKSQKIIKKILFLDEYKKSKNILLYYPFRNEVNLLNLIKISKDKNFYFPSVNFKTKKLCIKKLGKIFVKNRFGIYEPHKTEVLKRHNLIDIIFVPGIVFDKQCFRIGFGGGYYDKFLKNVCGVKIGVCYNTQLIETVPKNVYDIRLDYVITEKNIITKGEQI
ncbi:MAG: 5-formyltetrahydrofolate cyclo-ligase [Endomicrobiia bacterium]